jgi:hypothetical protein
VRAELRRGLASGVSNLNPLRALDTRK